MDTMKERHPLRSQAGDPWFPRQRPRGMTFLLLLLAVPILRAEPADRDYFPTEKGAQWVYKTTQKEKNSSFDMNVVIEGPWQAGGQAGVVMTQKDKRGTMRQFLLQNDRGVFMDKLGLSKSYTPEVTTRFTPAVPFVIFPLVPGTKVHWEGRLKIAWLDKPIVFDGEVVGWDELDVPAGHFRCIKLHYHEKRGEEIIDETAWYTEGVGQVKYDGGQYLKELKSYSGLGRKSDQARKSD